MKLVTFAAVTAATIALTIAAFVAIPAWQSYSGLKQSGQDASVLEVARDHWNLQWSALQAKQRVEVRESNDWRVGETFLEQLARAEEDSHMRLLVRCEQGSRAINLTRLSGPGTGTPPASVDDLVRATLNGSLKSGWVLTEDKGGRHTRAVRRLSGHGWSYRDTSAAEDASATLHAAFPEMQIDCQRAPATEGSAGALAYTGDAQQSAVYLTQGSATAPAGQQMFSPLLLKLGAVSVVGTNDARRLELRFAFGADAAAAGAAYLKAQHQFRSDWAPLSYELVRNGAHGERASNRYVVAPGLVAELSLSKDSSKAWALTYAIEATLPLQSSTHTAQAPVVDEAASAVADAASSGANAAPVSVSASQAASQ